MSDFQSLGLSNTLLRAVEAEGYTTPTPVQQQSIPPLLEGRDVLGVAQTGTGKTAAFALPVLQIMNRKKPQGKRFIRALILSPTRELAAQIDERFAAYSEHMDLRHQSVIFGGVNQNPQVRALQKGLGHSWWQLRAACWISSAKDISTSLAESNFSYSMKQTECSTWGSFETLKRSSNSCRRNARTCTVQCDDAKIDCQTRRNVSSTMPSWSMSVQKK